MLEGPGWHAWSLLSDGSSGTVTEQSPAWCFLLWAPGDGGRGGRAAGAQELCVLAEIPYLSDSQFPR